MTLQDITSELIEHLHNSKIPQGCDLSDLGNEIGILIGQYTDKYKLGYELESLLAGIKHGVSLTDGTHKGETVKTSHEYLENHFVQSLYTINGHDYKVSEIADWAKKNLRLVTLKISDIQSKYIDSKFLFTDVDENEDWYKRSMDSNLSFPILVLENPDGKWEIIDGNHRVWKAWKTGMNAINSYLVKATDLNPPESNTK